MTNEAFKKLLNVTCREIQQNLTFSNIDNQKDIINCTASIFRETMLKKLEEVECLNFHDYITHIEGCPHANKNMQYAYLNLSDEGSSIMSAEEYSFYYELKDNFLSYGIDLPMDDRSIAYTQTKLVYGGILFHPDFIRYSDIEQNDLLQLIVDSNYVRIEKNVATLCQCECLKLLPIEPKSEYFLPFAARMRLPFSLENRSSSITLSPLVCGENEESLSMWECMNNRPFILACRQEAPVVAANLNDCINLEQARIAYYEADFMQDIL